MTYIMERVLIFVTVLYYFIYIFSSVKNMNMNSPLHDAYGLALLLGVCHHMIRDYEAIKWYLILDHQNRRPSCQISPQSLLHHSESFPAPLPTFILT